MYYEWANDITAETFDDVDECISKIYATLLPKEKGSKELQEGESLIADYGIAFERQGFVQGFKYAMRLKGECGIV